MKFTFTLLLSVFIITCFAQTSDTRYFFLKFNGRYVSSVDSADYIRIVTDLDSGSLYHVAEYFKNHNKKLVGKSARVDPLVLEGEVTQYYPNGNIFEKAEYHNNAPIGKVSRYYPTGNLYTELEFPAKQKDKGKVDNTPDYLIITYNNPHGRTCVKNGNGYFVSFNNLSSRSIFEEGPVKNAMRDSTWIGSKVGYTFIEQYNLGRLISGKATDTCGNIYFYNTRIISPEFKGGMKDFYKFLAKNIEYPSVARSKNIQGRVTLSFIIGPNNLLYDIRILQPVCKELDEEAIRVVKLSAKYWTSGLNFGAPARVRYIVPVDFTLKN